MTSFDDVLDGNRTYAASFQDEGKPGQAAKGLAVVTCMDSRIEPLAMLGMERGDVKIIRNAGARVTSDVLRTLVLANVLLNVDRVLVVPHTECAMTGKTEEDVQQVLAERAGVDARSLHFSVMPDQRAALERDVQRIRSWPFLPKDLTVAGALYDVRTGRLDIVVP
ncbi:MAG: carbonic anhydrase [Frankiales bacterium]|nr:carbonic anhydrase [Frankiales bacterium]